MRFGSEFGLPVAVVMEERCRHCGMAAEDFPHREAGGELGPAGHVFERMPWPSLPGHEVDEGGQLIPAQGRGYDRLVATATYHGPRTDLEGVSVSVWKYRDRMRFPGQQARLDFVGAPEEWAPVTNAARVALARRVCPHVDQQVSAGVARIVGDDALDGDQVGIVPAAGYQMDLRVWCTDCGEPFVFVGDQLPVGVSPAFPTVDVAGTGLCVPLRPLQYPELWGRNRPGFGVRGRS